MRKIKSYFTLNNVTFSPELTMVIRDQDNNVIDVVNTKYTPSPKPKYSHMQLEQIAACEQALIERGQDPMTEDEIDYMFKSREGKDDKLSAEQLQQLAGFKVTKTITAV